MSKGHVYWITGLSGSGKSTLAHALHGELCKHGHKVLMLDGDVIRDLMMEESLFDRESRLKIAKFNARLCRFLAEQGINVVCATISLFHDVQDWNRQHIQHYTEVFLNTPLELLKKRDSKGIYTKAQSGEMKDVVGVNIPAEWPHAPEFTFYADGSHTPEQMVAIILQPKTKATMS